MSWRDDPCTIWQDKDGDWLIVGAELIGVGGSGASLVRKPDTVADRIEAGARFLAALGLTADDIREIPKPIEAGDIVKLGHFEVLYRVRHIDGDAAFLRRVSNDAPFACMLTEVVPVDGPAPEPEPGWIITRDPKVLAAALDAGRTVECYTGGRWHPTDNAARDFRRGEGELVLVDYRYEGPAIDPVVCTDGNQMCVPFLAKWCQSREPDGKRVCSRPPGHDGPHIACSPMAGTHNLATWEDDR